MPLSELVRLVRVYSQPWDEKSKSLKKLHDDYESKKSQLAIAIKRLQLLDAHVRRKALGNFPTFFTLHQYYFDAFG